MSVATLTNFLPHCHSRAVCLFGKPPRIQAISAELLRVHVSLGVFHAIFCIVCITLVIHAFIRNVAGLLYKLKAFTAPSGIRVPKRLSLEQ